MSRRGYDLALTLAGVIDEVDVQALSLELYYHCGVQPAEIYESLMCGECEFFFATSDDHTMPEDFAELAKDLHLSWMLYAKPCHEDAAHLTIHDEEIDAHAVFALLAEDDEPHPQDEGAARLIERWPHVDEAPRLHLVTSSHQALALAQSDDSQPKAVAAYLSRRAQRAAA